MSPERPVQPLVLRREPFGGILFDPFDGTHLELDAEAFEVVRALLLNGRAPATEPERALVSGVQREMPGFGAGTRLVRSRTDLPAPAPTRHANVLSSPTLVDLQVTTRCTMGCPQCYASSEPGGAHLPFADAARILPELADAGVCQIAIGGGEPLLHPEIVPILELCRDLGLVPNLTTTGIGLSPPVLDALAPSMLTYQPIFCVLSPEAL